MTPPTPDISEEAVERTAGYVEWTWPETADLLRALRAALTAANEREKMLREALRPFAARAALAQKEPPNG